jgi:hypothetical protein
MLAKLLAAIGTAETSVALAAHGGLLVPELVDVTSVGSSKLSDVLANTVARTGVGARSTLASNTVVAVVALALACGSVAITLVGALHVVVGRIAYVVEVRILHVRELLRSTVRVVETILQQSDVSVRVGAVHVEVALGGVDVGKTELAHSLRAVVGLPVAVADAHVVRGALSMARAGVGALRGHAADETKEDRDKDDQSRHPIAILLLLFI